MATTVIAKNQTAFDIPVKRLKATNGVIPGSGQETISDYNTIQEIQRSDELFTSINSGSILLSVDAIDLTQAESLTFLNEGEKNTVTIVGTGTSFFKEKVGTDIRLKSLLSSSSLVTLTGNTNDIDIGLDSSVVLESELDNIPGAVNGVVLLDTSAGTRISYASITLALAAASAGDVVICGPGTYAESFTVPAGVTVLGQSGSRVTKITGTLATGTRVALNNGAVLRGFQITLPTDATYAIEYAGAAPSLAVSRDIVFIGSGGSGKCYGQTGSGSSEIMDSFIQQGSMACVFEVTNGELFVRSTLISKYVTAITDAVLVSGGLFAFDGMVLRGAGITDGISCGAGQVIGTVAEFQDLTGSALHITSGSADVQIRNLRCAGCGLDLEVDAAASSCTVHLSGAEMLEANISADDNFHANADHFLAFQDETIGDASFKVWGKLSVGSQNHGTYSYFGQGGQNTANIYCFRNTNLEIGTWSDVTTILKSESSSTTAIFTGVTAGNCFYFGNDRPFTGSYLNITTAGVAGTGVAIFEYWNGSAWTSAAIMATDDGSPHNQYGSNIAGIVGEYQLRAGPLPGWTTKSLNGTTAYWVRYRLVTAYTSSPILEQMKATVNSIRIGPHGFLEYFGESRPRRSMLWHLGLLEDRTGWSPVDENIDFSTNVQVGLVDNEFANGTIDGRAGIVDIPFGLDTSYPLTLTIKWMKTAAGSGDVELELAYSKAADENVFDGTLSETILTDITNVTGDAQYYSYTTSFTIPVYDMIPGYLLGISIFRDASGGNLDDTFADGIALLSTTLKGYFWS